MAAISRKSFDIRNDTWTSAAVEMWNTVTELVAKRQATPQVRVRTKGVDDLLYWIEERERVRIRKEAGAPGALYRRRDFAHRPLLQRTARR